MTAQASRRSGVAAVLLVVPLVAGSASADGSNVESVLAPHGTTQALSGFMVVEPTRCIDLTSDRQVCMWQLGNRNSSWNRLAGAIGTKDRINVICTVPKVEGTRAEGSCAGYPQRSNRDQFEVARPVGKRNRSARNESAEQRRKQKADAARSQLHAARDLESLVALMGTLPEACVGEIGADRTCLWQLSARTLGHGTVAASAGIPLRHRARLGCPIDAANRLRGECRAESQ